MPCQTSLSDTKPWCNIVYIFRLHNTHAHTHALAHPRTRTPTHSHTHALTHPRTHTPTHSHMHACTHVRMEAHTSTLMYAHTRMHAHAHVRTPKHITYLHTHTHTHTHFSYCQKNISWPCFIFSHVAVSYRKRKPAYCSNLCYLSQYFCFFGNIVFRQSVFIC